jgi:hypothetical protein
MVVELSLEIILPSNKCGHFLLQFAAVCPTRALSAGAHMPDAHALRRRALAPARSPPARTCAHLPLRARALRQVTRGARALSAGAHMPDARALRRRAHARRARSPPARTCAGALSAGAHLRALAPTRPRAPSSSPGRAHAPPRDPHARALSRARAQPHIDPTRPCVLPPPCTRIAAQQ